MERMEELIRESLKARAQDVEPTPALWLEVDRRVTRRRRFQVVSWSLAGVTAVLAAVLALPAVTGLFSGPETLEIPPLDRTPTAGVVSTHVVAVDDQGTATLVDLRTGEMVRELVALDHPVAALDVSPVSTVDAVEFVAASASGEVSIVGEGEVVWSGGGTDAPDDFAWSVVTSPDGRWAAGTSPTEESDGSTVSVAPLVSRWAEEEPTWTEVGLVVDRASRLVAWTGETAEDGDRSTMWLLTADGTLVREQLETTGGIPSALEMGESDGGTPVLDAATSFVNGGADGEPFYLLRRSDGGIELHWSGAAGRTATVPLGQLLGDVDPADLWLDAKQDGALVGDGERTWLFAHDGAGSFTDPVRLPDGLVRAGLLDVDRPGGTPVDEPTDEATGEVPEEPAEPPAGEPTDPDAPETDGPNVEGATLPAPLVTVSMRDLVLHAPDGPQTLYSLAVEGESVFVAARVRPGSTVEDLTVVALTQGEGMFDLRTFRWVDGELSWEYFPDEYQPGSGGATGADAMVAGPVWSPDGEHLAWFEFGAGASTLRTVGWDDGPGTGDPASDNAAFEIDTRGQMPLFPVEWVPTPGGPLATEIRAVALESNEGWYALPVDIQPDGALALAGEQVRAEPGVGAAQVAGIAAGEGDGVAWLLQLTFDGAELYQAPRTSTERRIELPDDLLPGDGLVELWVRAVGDGALVGSRNTSVSYYVAPDGTLNRLPGEVSEADVID